MLRREIRHRIEDALFVLLLRVLWLLPHRATGSLGRFASALSFRLGIRRRVVMGNLRRVFPQWSERRRRALALKSATTLGGYFFQEISATRFERSDFARSFDIEGEEHLDEALASGKGLILLTGHFGAFDFGVYPLGQKLGTINMVVQPHTNPYFRARVEALRQKMGTRTIPRRRAAHRMLNLLRRGGHVGLAIDQRVPPWDGILLPFLGVLGWTSPVPALLALRTGSPALPLFCEAGEGGRWRLLVRPPIFPTGLGVDPVGELTELYLQAVEREVRRAPVLWFWSHDRWRLLWRHRQAQTLERLYRESQLPCDEPTLDTDWETARRLSELVDTGFLGTPRHAALLARDRGRRQAVLAELGRRTIERGSTVRYIAAADLERRLQRTQVDDALPQKLRRLDTFALLIVDGVDSLADLEGIRPQLLHREQRGSVLVGASHELWQAAKSTCTAPSVVKNAEVTALDSDPTPSERPGRVSAANDQDE